jgi:hypothetical protein
MPTALDLIRRSMRLIGALAEGEVPTAEQSADALVSLRGLLGEWETRGVPLGALVDATIANATTLPVPPTHYNALAYNLAVTLAPEYGREAALPVLGPLADRTFRALQAQYKRAPTITADPAVLRQRGILGNAGYLVWTPDGALYSDSGPLYP